jgi:hypothetical protein
MNTTISSFFPLSAMHRSNRDKLCPIFRFADGQEVMLPLDIAIQSILSLLLTMFGVLHIAGEFKVKVLLRIVIVIQSILSLLLTMFEVLHIAGEFKVKVLLRIVIAI